MMDSKRVILMSKEKTKIMLAPKPVKRLLPKPGGPSNSNSMSLENTAVKTQQIKAAQTIGRVPYLNATKKTDIQTVSLQKKTLLNRSLSPILVKVLPPKPKSSTAAVPLAKYVGSTVILNADADLTPARNQVIYSTVPDNNQSLLPTDTLDTKTHTENAIEEECCTNNNINDKDSKAHEDLIPTILPSCINRDILNKENPFWSTTALWSTQLNIDLEDPFNTSSFAGLQTTKKDKTSLDTLQSEIDLFNDTNITARDIEHSTQSEEVITEIEVPVTTTACKDNPQMDSFMDTWGPDSLLSENDSLPTTNMFDPYMMVSPFVVEGRTASVVQYPEGEVSQAMASPQQTRMSSELTEVSQEDLADFGLINEVLDKFEMKVDEEENSSDGLDLLGALMDDTIGEEVLASYMNADDTDLSTINFNDLNINGPTAEPTAVEATTVDEAWSGFGEHGHEVEEVQEPEVRPTPQKRGPGRPRKLRLAVANTAPKRRGRPEKQLTAHHNYSNDGGASASTSDESREGQRYRRMRNLNNVASQRCRRNRKVKMQAAYEEIRREEARNVELTMKVEKMEAIIKVLKKKLIKKISNPAKPSIAFDIDQFVNRRAEKELGGNPQ